MHVSGPAIIGVFAFLLLAPFCSGQTCNIECTEHYCKVENGRGRFGSCFLPPFSPSCSGIPSGCRSCVNQCITRNVGPATSANFVSRSSTSAGTRSTSSNSFVPFNQDSSRNQISQRSLQIKTTSSCQCGKANLRSGRILGGKITNPNKYPWQVRVIIKDKNQDGQCGGSLLSSRWVLTAAHCVDQEFTRSLRIILGDHYKNIWEPSEMERRVSLNMLHPNYRKDSMDYDFALLKLSHDVSFSYYIRPICLPTKRNYVGMRAVATGWGVDKITPEVIRLHKEEEEYYDSMPDDYDDLEDYYYDDRKKRSVESEELKNRFIEPKELKKRSVESKERQKRSVESKELKKRSVGSNELKEVDLKVVPKSQCGTDPQDITPRMMCAKGERGKDTCLDDSGGPLMALVGGRYELIGVISFSDGETILGCADPNFAGVYSDVSSILGWIKRFVNDIKCQ